MQGLIFFYLLFYVGVEWIKNAVLVSDAQQSDSVIHIHVSVLFQILFPFSEFSHSVMSNFLWPHGLQHARPSYQEQIFFFKGSFASVILKQKHNKQPSWWQSCNKRNKVQWSKGDGGCGRREKLGGRKSQGLWDHVDSVVLGCVYFTQVTLRLLSWHPVISYMWHFLVPYSDGKVGRQWPVCSCSGLCEE